MPVINREVSDEDYKKILASWDNEDFFDIQSKKFLAKEREDIQRGWSEVFGKEYNKEIDRYADAEPKLKTQEFKNLVKESLYGKDHINPQHYKNVAAGKQYMELMVDMLERFNGVEAHLMGQVYKYLMRAKLKDPLPGTALSVILFVLFCDS